jgi:hypothetical protein
MKHTLHVHVHLMDQLQLAEIKAVAESDTATADTKKLAKAVLELSQSVHDLTAVLRTIAESGALRVTET